MDRRPWLMIDNYDPTDKIEQRRIKFAKIWFALGASSAVFVIPNPLSKLQTNKSWHWGQSSYNYTFDYDGTTFMNCAFPRNAGHNLVLFHQKVTLLYFPRWNFVGLLSKWVQIMMVGTGHHHNCWWLCPHFK